MKTRFTPLEQLLRSLRWWWLVVILSIAGGAAGFIVHHLLPPVFLARAEITTSINFLQTGNLTDVKQDQAISAVGDLIRSDTVEQAVLSQANENEISIDAYQFEKSRFLDRMEYRWILGFESTNAKMAADLTNLWAQEAISQLEESLTHAINANTQMLDLNRLETCLQRVSVVAPGYSACPQVDLYMLQTTIAQNTTQISTEVKASRGIIPAMSFALTSTANPAGTPTYRNRNLMVFAGVLIGFIAGLLVMQSLPISNPVKQK